MKSIIYLGMDVHSTNYTFCCLEPVFMGEDKIFGITQVAPEVENVVKYIEAMKLRVGRDTEFICGYEAGCLGYSLQRQLAARKINCIILAPSTMLSPQGKRIKTDKRDAKLIAQCLAHGGYSPVAIPTEEDEAVKEYIRMRDDHQEALKRVKQQINALCLRHGKHFADGHTWTKKHLDWLSKLDLGDIMLAETLQEYMATFYILSEKLEVLDQRIKELASQERYAENVQRLCCLLGVKTTTALSSIVEVGDFRRFSKGNLYAAYLGLIPGEHSSSNDYNHLSLTKAGNKHLRTLYIEAAGGICKGRIGFKSKELKARQAGSPPEVIAYADKANIRMRRKYYRMIRNGKKRNVAVAAIARELACFIWGMMTNNISEVVI